MCGYRPQSAWRWTRPTADRTSCWPRAGPSSSPGRTGIRTSWPRKFREKYAQSLGAMSFDQWRSTFSQPLLVHVERIIAWTRTAAGVAYRVVP